MTTTKPEADQMVDARAEFEAWITSPPYEKPVTINPESSGWPGQYRAYEVQLAWEAYQSGRAECEKLRRDAERYRWLRDPCSGAERVVMYGRGDYGRGLMTYTMLDEAIDAVLEPPK